MPNNSGHDTVTALAESDATGDIAKIFADIRETMQIPMLTSVWRILAESKADLASTWNAVKPLYATGQPEAALARLRADAKFPELKPATMSEFESVSVSASDLESAKAIVAAYNRSNSLNLLTQTAIVVDRSSEYEAYPSVGTDSVSHDLPHLLPRDEIADDVWETVVEINLYGTTPGDVGLATIYRHLAHYPGVLSLMKSRLAIADEQGAIAKGAISVSEISLEEGARMAHLRDESLRGEMSDHATEYVANYVDGPFHVARIVNIGTALARWLDIAE